MQKDLYLTGFLMSRKFEIEIIEPEEVEIFRKNLAVTVGSLLSRKMTKRLKDLTDPDRILAWLRKKGFLDRLVNEVVFSPAYSEMWRREYTKCLKYDTPQNCRIFATNLTIAKFLKRKKEVIDEMVKAYLEDNVLDIVSTLYRDVPSLRYSLERFIRRIKRGY